VHRSVVFVNPVTSTVCLRCLFPSLVLQDNPEIALVQARWSFVNKDENLLTKLQNINLAFHFEVEQQVNGIFLNFFGFNGTAGVWEDQRRWRTAEAGWTAPRWKTWTLPCAPTSRDGSSST